MNRIYSLKKAIGYWLLAFGFFSLPLWGGLWRGSLLAQERRPIDAQHPLWMVHVDVWFGADPQKTIDLIPDDIKPYVCMNLSLSCQYDTEKNVYKMPQNAVKTYKSWASVCQQNGMWFTCQPASGGHTHIQDDDLETFEYFFKRYPNFLGWNYAEQFWGFDESGDKSSSSQVSRIALFAKLVPMSHRYGGFLTVSFCGNIWSHLLNPVGMMKRNTALRQACRDYPDAILWLYKYTTGSCWYNNESVTFSPFISGLAQNYGVRYDNCGWDGALGSLFGDDHGKKYPAAAGIGTVMEQCGINGGAVWDGPELTWTQDMHEVSQTTVNGYKRRNWATFPVFDNVWIDMFRKIIDGTLYIPSRKEVVENTKIVVVNNVSSGSDEQKYAAWGDLYDGVYKQTDPFNKGTGQWMDNMLFFKKTGRYRTIPVAIELYDSLAKAIPVKVNKSNYSSRWSTQAKKVADFDEQYPEVSSGDLFVARHGNQLVTYTPYSYCNVKTTASAEIPLKYNTCKSLTLEWGKLSSGLVREYADRIDFYLNNYRVDTTTLVLDKITVSGASAEPTYTITKRQNATASVTKAWNAESGAFTLNVKHLGPVDITINCSGAETERSKDYLPSTALSLDLPKQPEDFYGDIVIEAEDMDWKNMSCVTNPYYSYPNERGHAGNGFMDTKGQTGGALTHSVKIAHAGKYNIAVRYTSPSKKGSLVANANGTRKALVIEKTATNEWRKVSFEAELKEGANTLTLTNSTGHTMYIDNVTYHPADLPFEKFAVVIKDADNGRVVADVDSAEEGSTVTLSVEPDEGYRLKGYTIVHGDVTIGSDGTFVMPDDNVTLQPVFEDMSCKYELKYDEVLAGNIPEGWRCVQEDNTVHEYPNSYSAGARVFSGFTGYQGKALYWRESVAEYGRQTAYPLTLDAGSYKLQYATAAWKSNPRYKVRILDQNDDIIKESAVRIATPNANGSTGADVSKASEFSMDFDIETAGKYVISFINTDYVSGYDEFLLLECKVVLVPDGIEAAPQQGEGELRSQGAARREQGAGEVYDLAGRKVQLGQLGQLAPLAPSGLYIINGKKIFVK